MNKSIKKSLIAASVTLALGAVIAFVLFYFSDMFFDIKTLQTQVSGGFIGSDKGGSTSSSVIPRGGDVPDVRGVEIRTGEEISLSSFTDKIVVLNFWASWCEPCLDEFPSFASMLSKVGNDVVFIGVSQDKDKVDAESFLKAFSAELEGLNTYFIHDDNKGFAKEYGVLALPETFIVDPKMKLIHRVSGFENWSSPSAINFFEGMKKKHL